MDTTNKRLHDHASGAILGALIGDAAGATLEFLGRMPNQNDVRMALRMVGGGVWETAPGQITDDGEMTMALCQALIGCDEYNANHVARYYRRWRLSDPFDIGRATAGALSEGEVHSLRLAETVYANAQRHNSESLANGCLMRATPLGVWAARHSLETAIAAAQDDARLTHPAPLCQWATAAYVVAIRHLMLNPGDHLGAFEQAEAIVPPEDGVLLRRIFREIRERAPLPDSTHHAGYVLTAFQHAFHHLYQASSYVTTLSEVMLAGGDTDTNACIAGGLTGALWGKSALPEAMLDAILNCNVLRGQPRPAWLQTCYAEPCINNLLKTTTKPLGAQTGN